MRQAAGVMAALLAIGMVWPLVAAVGGGGAADSAQASESAEAPVAAPAPIPEVEIPSMPAAKSAEAEASEPVITPPPPVPEVEIPAIPPVDPKYPFKQSVYKPPVKGGPAPLEEGKRIFDREGRFDHDAEGNPVFVFDSGDTPMRLLESRWREYLESVTDEGRKHARWRVSGIVTLYYRHNYLLLMKVVRIEAEEEGL